MWFDLFTIRSFGNDARSFCPKWKKNGFLSLENLLVYVRNHRFWPERKSSVFFFHYFKCFLPCCVWQAIFLFRPTCSNYIGFLVFFFGESDQQKEKFTNWPQILLWPDIRLVTETTMTHMFFFSCVKIAFACTCVKSVRFQKNDTKK